MPLGSRDGVPFRLRSASKPRRWEELRLRGAQMASSPLHCLTRHRMLCYHTHSLPQLAPSHTLRTLWADIIPTYYSKRHLAINNKC